MGKKILVIVDYSQIDQSIFEEFKGTHPMVVQEWLPKETGLYKADIAYKLTQKEKKYRILKRLENLFNIDFSKKHFKLIK